MRASAKYEARLIRLAFEAPNEAPNEARSAYRYRRFASHGRMPAPSRFALAYTLPPPATPTWERVVI